MIINGEKRKIAMEIAYILMLMSAAMGDLKVFSVSQTRMMKAISLFIVVMAAAYLFISGRLERVKTAASFVGVYGFVLIGIIVWSIFLWIINIESIDFILRGASKFMYQFLVLLIIFSGAYLFGERAIFTTFYGLAAANMLMVVYNLGVYGISDSINSVIAMLMGSDAQEGRACYTTERVEPNDQYWSGEKVYTDVYDLKTGELVAKPNYINVENYMK